MLFGINEKEFQENQATYRIYKVDHRLCEVIGMRVRRAVLLILEGEKMTSHHQVLIDTKSQIFREAETSERY